MSRKLAGRDRRSTGRADEVARDLRGHPEMVAEAVRLLGSGDAVLRPRSADALETASRGRPSLLWRHQRALLRLAVETGQPEVRWHLAQVLPRLRLNPADRSRALLLLRSYLGDESRIVRVCALQALWELCPNHRGVRALVERVASTGSPAERARARKLLG